MIKYFLTTTLILFWSFVLSGLVSFVFYSLLVRFPKIRSASLKVSTVLPALVLAPVLIVAAYSLFGWNLIFPVSAFSSVDDFFLVSLAPALVLVVAGGWLTQLCRNLSQEYEYWRTKSFALVSRFYGRSEGKSLRRVVISKSYCSTVASCLPWVFGEIIVVESLFNAPGLGLDAWTAAKVRDFPRLVEALFWLLALYGVFALLNSVWSRRIGKKLGGYY